MQRRSGFEVRSLAFAYWDNLPALGHDINLHFLEILTVFSSAKRRQSCSFLPPLTVLGGPSPRWGFSRCPQLPSGISAAVKNLSSLLFPLFLPRVMAICRGSEMELSGETGGHNAGVQLGSLDKYMLIWTKKSQGTMD